MSESSSVDFIEVFLALAGAICFVVFYREHNKDSKRRRELFKKDLDKGPFEYQSFLSGHPDLIRYHSYRMDVGRDYLYFFTLKNELCAKIPINSIDSIELIDESTEDQEPDDSYYWILSWVDVYLLKKGMKKQPDFRIHIRWHDDNHYYDTELQYNDEFGEERAHIAYEALQIIKKGDY